LFGGRTKSAVQSGVQMAMLKAVMPAPMALNCVLTVSMPTNLRSV
jgi:hypothetical protein